MVFQGAKEPVICQAFPLTLKAEARRWLSLLPVGSIPGWKALKDKFISNFTSSKQQFKTKHHLERIRQKSDEPLMDFIIRFNAESLEVRNVAPNLMLYFLMQGLKPGGFAKDLAGEKPKTMEELKRQAEKWIQIEEWVRNNKVDNQPARQEKHKKEKQKATYGGKPRESERTYDRSGRPPKGGTQTMRL
jgi:hypothetical protein